MSRNCESQGGRREVVVSDDRRLVTCRSLAFDKTGAIERLSRTGTGKSGDD
ncbi:MAG: hypothetical protein KDA96_07310 [Planctomycetaceae bacterium]|nr:hypothetical protein [Planctomycetaceae bacterium]